MIAIEFPFVGIPRTSPTGELRPGGKCSALNVSTCHCSLRPTPHGEIGRTLDPGCERRPSLHHFSSSIDQGTPLIGALCCIADRVR